MVLYIITVLQIYMPTKQKAIYRTDLLPHRMNAGKEAKVRALLSAWRNVAVCQAGEQWKLFFTTGRVSKKHNVSRTGYEIVGTAYGQMVRWQVVGQIESWLSNRSNDFRDLVNRSSLDADIKHQLHFINRWQAWYDPKPLTMKDGKQISGEVRKLARTIFRHLLNRHRKPNLSKASMLIDQRCISVTKANRSSVYPLWARISTLDKGKRIDVPLQTYLHFDNRQGERSASVQIVEREGQLSFGLMTDIAATCESSRKKYVPRTEVIALDLGLKTLFATDQGDLLGQGWLAKLHEYDCKITKLAKYRQQHGMKVRSERYKRYVAQLRGFVRSEIGRILNRLVQTHAPAEIVVERLRFQNPNLSKRLNRILSKFGKNEVTRKLKDLEERFGITSTEINPAYTSQADSACGYVDKLNRPRQAAFCCRWCGSKRHADVNAARNILNRRSASVGDYRRPKQAILADLVLQFNERHTRPKGGATDPRLKNPYFKGWKPMVTLSASG
jgi:putative transposase